MLSQVTWLITLHMHIDSSCIVEYQRSDSNVARFLCGESDCWSSSTWMQDAFLFECRKEAQEVLSHGVKSSPVVWVIKQYGQ